VEKPLDREIYVTWFDDEFARTKQQESGTLRELAEHFQTIHAANKKELPFLKLARFKGQPNDQGCLRYDENILCVTGIEGDYDGEQVSLHEACGRLQRANLGALLSALIHRRAGIRWRM
jgi:hypothetical protein